MMPTIFPLEKEKCIRPLRLQTPKFLQRFKQQLISQINGQRSTQAKGSNQLIISKVYSYLSIHSKQKCPKSSNGQSPLCPQAKQCPTKSQQIIY